MGKALMHKACASEMNGECPRCKYYKNWNKEEQGDPDREWTEEENIRLIVLCGEGLSKNTIRREMNVSLKRIERKIEKLVAQKRVIYKRKKQITHVHHKQNNMSKDRMNRSCG